MLELRDISMTYQSTELLQHIHLNVEDNEILCLLGSSGSGKTTLLRIIAGLENNYRGDIIYNGETINAVPPHQRGFGLMFQDFALFPHMTVFDNIAFGLRMRGTSSAAIQKRVTEMLDLVGLHTFAQREVSRLSGGEKQRVALARSLAPAPELLMLDEPLGALDEGLRERLLDELRQIIKGFGVAAVYVTHDQHEAYAIADRIAILHAGKIEQIDTPVNLYRHPATIFVAQFLGLQNAVPSSAFSDIFPHIQTPFMLLHPDGLHLREDGILQGTLLSSKFQGNQNLLTVQCNQTVLSFPAAAQQEQIPLPGSHVRIAMDLDLVIPLRE